MQKKKDRIGGLILDAKYGPAIDPCLYMISSDVLPGMVFFAFLCKSKSKGMELGKSAANFCVTEVACLTNSGKKQEKTAPKYPGMIIFRIKHCSPWDCTSHFVILFATGPICASKFPAQRRWCLKWDLRLLRFLLNSPDLSPELLDPRKSPKPAQSHVLCLSIICVSICIYIYNCNYVYVYII